MDAMQAVADALGELADEELQDLRDAANELVLMAAGLVSWVEHLVHWEANRRAGVTLDLQSPHVAIPPAEHAVSADAAALLKARFEQTPQQDRNALFGVFDAIGDALGAPPSLRLVGGMGDEISE